MTQLTPIDGGVSVHAAELVEPKTVTGVNASMTGDDGAQEQLIDKDLSKVDGTVVIADCDV